MRVLLFLLLLALSFPVKAQEKTWKRRVSRTIDIRDLQHPDNSGHRTLSEALLRAVKTQKIKAYTPYDNNFTTLMTAQEFAIHCEIDTMYVYDSASGRDIVKERNQTIAPDSIYAYRVFEDWTFDPIAGKLMIQAKYVAPLENVYGDDGTFRGRRPLFWIGYQDFSSAMEITDILQIQLFYRHLWQSYFDNTTLPLSNDYFNTKNGLWSGNAIIVIDMKEPEDTGIHFLRSENNDTLLSEQILNNVKQNAIPAWTGYDELLSPALTSELLQQAIAPKYDTQEIDSNKLKIIARDFNYETVHKYLLRQSWSFNSITGKTDVETKTIAPLKDIYQDNGTVFGTKPMFWIRYSDLQPILDKSEQYHPTNTFAMHIWNSFFLSDKKPELQK